MSSRLRKVGWVLSGSRQTAGARLQGYLMHETMLKMGVVSRLLFAPEVYTEELNSDQRQGIESCLEGLEVLVFQKVFGVEARALLGACRRRGIKTVYIACNLQGHDMVALADRTICVSSTLKKCFGCRLSKKITVIEDPVEVSTHPGKQDYGSGDKLRLVYVAGEPMPEQIRRIFSGIPDVELHEITGKSGAVSFQQIEYESIGRTSLGPKLGRALRMPPRDVLTKVRHRAAIHKDRRLWNMGAEEGRELVSVRHIWDAHTVADDIVRHDVAVIPCELVSEWNLCKSGNRATMFMGLGMPVVASPLPAYKEVMAHGHTGFISHTRKEWHGYLDALRDPKLREHVGQAARKDVLSKYTPEITAEKYLEVFGQALQVCKTGVPTNVTNGHE